MSDDLSDDLGELVVGIIGALIGVGTVIAVCEKKNKRDRAQHQKQRDTIQKSTHTVSRSNESLRKQREEAMRNRKREIDILANY